MSETRRWYLEPETFIAAAALIVSLSAVAVGIYEASLQRHHDRAEVWPHVEIGTYTSPKGAAVIVENTGIGPAIVKYVQVYVDGKPLKNWPEILTAWMGKVPALSDITLYQHGLRAGDQVQMVAVGTADLPPNFWEQAKRIRVRICYASVFDEYWMTEETLGGHDTEQQVEHCPTELPGTDL